MLAHSFFTSRELENHFLKCALWTPLEQFWPLSFAFPENCFKPVTQKFSRNWKTPFSNAHNIKVDPIRFSKMLPITNFGFTHFSIFCLPLSMVSISSIKKFEKKKEKCHFGMLKTFVFDLEVASKPFSKMPAITNLDFNSFNFRLCVVFPENSFIFSLKNLKKVRNALFQRSGYSFLMWR